VSLPPEFEDEAKRTLHRYLRRHREALVWKVRGLPERDQRWPATPTGTNLLGLLKHCTVVEAGYLGDVFGRPVPDAPAWLTEEPSDPLADLYATAEESPVELLALHERVAAHADATVEELPLDGLGHVPWWGEQGEVTLHQILVHLLAEYARHAGHADIVREGIDGLVGMAVGSENLPEDGVDWAAHVARLRDLAEGSAAEPTDRG